MSESSASRASGNWCFLGESVPRSEIVFFVQIIIVYSVIITSLFNLSQGVEPQNLWIALLSSSLGYVLPNPNLRTNNG